MIRVAKLDTAAGYSVTCERLPPSGSPWLSSATHRVTLQDAAGVTVRTYPVPAGSDACALARSRNVVDLIGSGLLDPAPASRKATGEADRLWTSVLMLPAGEIAIPAMP